MNELSATIHYGKSNNFDVLQITGALRFNQCGVLEYFLKDHMPAHKPQDLLIDLSDAALLDSTALGLLAQIALQYDKLMHKKPNLYCPNNDLKQILLSMSLEQLFHLIPHYQTSNTLAPLVIPADTELAQTKRMLTAHETLMDLSKDNKKEFKSVVDLLQEALRDKNK